MKKMLVVFAFCFAVFNSDGAVDWDIYDDASIQNGDVYSAVNVFSDSFVEMTGGGINILKTFDTAEFAIIRGDVSAGIQLYDSSTVNIYDGNIFGLTANDASTVNIYGGGLEYQYGISSEAVVNYFVSSYSLYDAGGQGVIMNGYWKDGSPFSVSFRDSESWDKANIIIVPEPATVLFFGLAGGVLYNRRKA
ncbi:PEP-CTERM sorting domain-containing protein [Sedimentisphaera salicampi]|uniref:PEP-CTERM protein-sorting domain-containing protein n=1 Tax=Sedimentisphaera salicampi TaxID=1941349 RepID=A0A1W6LIS9_9BACT|nr:PEP-CTERM sorting domain-containing protein [Sedimentisphaera salicampi]ARN55697.1 hypothetical protein STSP1_00060 [Sedimentisphaera salicampi]